MHFGFPYQSQPSASIQPAQYSATTPHDQSWGHNFFAQSGHVPFQQQAHTISPSQLGPTDVLKATKSFSDLMMESRASSSSASSTEGGMDWSNALDDWTRPMPRALLPDQLRLAQIDPTIPEPTRRPTSATPSHASPLQYSTTAPSALGNALRQYISSPNRLAFGERKIVVMSPKVGQKSYGTEKRFLCPHPQAMLVGETWWKPSPDGCPISPIQPPRVNISLAGEQPVKDATVSWSTIDGRNLDEKINTQAIGPNDHPFLGNVAGKNLHISDNDGKRRELKALVTIKAPLKLHAGPNGWGMAKNTLSDISNSEVIGTFESKEIRVISKPAKKKSNSKSTERKCSRRSPLTSVTIQHGSTVALFNRVKSQTTSTRYLSVTPDLTRILGSDGKPVAGARPPALPTTPSFFPGFTASASVWESFIIWLIDPTKPPGIGLGPPLHPDWPNAPANAINPGVLAPPIRYNSLVVLQSLQTGICSPTLVIRRIEQDADVVGMDGTSADFTLSLPEGESPGDLVSQLQKVAFEIYRPESTIQVGNSPRQGSLWLSCDQDAIAERFIHSERRWAPLPPPRSGSRPSSVPNTPNQRFGVLPMTPHTTTMNLPSTPSSPVSSSSSIDYFGAHSRKSSSSALFSPPMGDIPLPSTDGGPIRRQRTGSTSRAGPFTRPMHTKRKSADGSGSYEYVQQANNSPSEGRVFWTMDVGDTCVWSIVSTEQVTYTFYVPSYVTEVTEPLAPFPSVSRLLPPSMANDQGPPKFKHSQWTNAPDLPPLITL
jgi:hypothetical protein